MLDLNSGCCVGQRYNVNASDRTNLQEVLRYQNVHNWLQLFFKIQAASHVLNADRYQLGEDLLMWTPLREGQVQQWLEEIIEEGGGAGRRCQIGPKRQSQFGHRHLEAIDL